MNLERILKLAQAADLLKNWPALKPLHDLAMKELTAHAETVKVEQIEAFDDEGETDEEKQVGRRA